MDNLLKLNDANLIVNIDEYLKYLFQFMQTSLLAIDVLEVTITSISVHIYNITPNSAATIDRFRHEFHLIR